jgi:hypothetical protein
MESFGKSGTDLEIADFLWITSETMHCLSL